MEFKDMSPDEVLAWLELESKIKKLDMDKLAEQKLHRLEADEQLKLNIAEGKRFDRSIKAIKKSRGPGRPKLHWKQRKKRINERMKKQMRKYRAEVARPKRLRATLEAVESGDWLDLLTKNWRRRKLTVTISHREWMADVAPALVGHIPVVFRYDTGKGYSLDNIFIKDSNTRQVLFDGAERLLVRLGMLQAAEPKAELSVEATGP